MKLKYFTRDNTWMTKDMILGMIKMEFGWGNGYVVIPEGHPLHGMEYDEIYEVIDIQVHGGLTFSAPASDLIDNPKWAIEREDKNSWIIGFDTMHFGDNSYNCSESYVINECKNLISQIEEMELVNLDKRI